WPCEILRENKGRDPKQRPKGKQAGVRNSLRARAHRTPLPSILLANVQSLENKLDDLRARVKFQRDIRDCNLLCFTETWLNPAVQTSVVMKCLERLQDKGADSGRKQERNYQTPVINESPVERVGSFRYLGVHITQDLSWFCHINTVVKKAWQSLYHLRCLRYFRLPSKVLRNFYSCTIESILMGNSN
ncbi:hypothetical protein QTP86_027001, partial [Hemibagrus guttatus]